MKFEEHYGENTPYITLDGCTPHANSMPINKCFLGAKFAKKLRKSKIEIDNYMNVIYESKQAFEGDVLQWKLRDLELDVVLVDCTKLFVKGRYFWVYCVGIMA